MHIYFLSFVFFLPLNQCAFFFFFFFIQTHTHTHHSGVTGVVSWRECVGDLGVITAWLSDSSDDDIQRFELLWPGPAPNTTRQYTLSTSQPCIHVA